MELLIEKGVDVSCKDKVALFSLFRCFCKCGVQDGKTPHQLARNGEIRKLLRQHYVALILLSISISIPNKSFLCVLGSGQILGSSSARKGSSRHGQNLRDWPGNGGENDLCQFASLP